MADHRLVCDCSALLGGNKIQKSGSQRGLRKERCLGFEQLVNLCMGVLKANLTNKTWKYLPFMGTVMIMMVISNLMGLLGLQSPTSNLTLDMVLVAMMILLIHGTDIRLHGIIGKLKGWCEPMAFLFPLNVIGDLAFPVSLTLRLFGKYAGRNDYRYPAVYAGKSIHAVYGTDVCGNTVFTYVF